MGGVVGADGGAGGGGRDCRVWSCSSLGTASSIGCVLGTSRGRERDGVG